MTATYDLMDGVRAQTSVKFPTGQYGQASTYCRDYFGELARAISSIDDAQVDRAAEILVEAYIAGSTVLTCGNGGSAAIANHLQCDHLKGVRTGTDLLPKVLSLSANVELLTAIANDIGYEDVFIYQLQSQAGPGDVLMAISSSGGSPNIVHALKWARRRGLRTIALTGFSGGVARKVAEVSIHIDCRNYGIVEDIHQAVMHTLAQYVRLSRIEPDMVAVTSF